MQSNDDFRKDDLNNLKEKAEKDLFEVIGAKDIPDEEKGELLNKMLDLVESRALLKMIDGLSEEQKQELTTIQDQDDPDKLEEYLLKIAPNFPDLYVDEAKKLRQELIIDHN